MTYLRFLINKDYKAVLTQAQFNMLVQNDENRLSQAEQAAEMNFLEYLDQHYEIEKLFWVGKSIREYNSGVTYPANSFFKTDDGIFKTLTAINGCKKPTLTIYWEQLTDSSTVENIDKKPKYSQLQTYGTGDVVKFSTEYWVCKVPNGYDLDNIQIPGTTVWQEVGTTAWEPNMTWELNDVCSYDGNFYIKSKESEDTAEVLTPVDDDSWSQIGDYSSDYNYSLNQHDYVVSDGHVFEPLLNPNADKVDVGTNIVADDPRNLNVIAHMVRISTYYLHQMVSPTNISESRRLAYEDSMAWLSNAARFKINPKIMRKQEHPSGDSVVDFAVDTYQRQFDPYDDMWLI